MTKEIRITYSQDIPSRKKPGTFIRKQGEQVTTKGDLTQGLIALLEYKPGVDTQTTNPALPYAAGDVRQTRTLVRACLGTGSAGNPDDVFELLIDGKVYRRTTRAGIVLAMHLCGMINDAKRAFFAGNVIPVVVDNKQREALEAAKEALGKAWNDTLESLLAVSTTPQSIVEVVAEIPGKDKKPKAEADDADDDDEQIF